MSRAIDNDAPPAAGAIVLRRLAGAEPLRYYAYVPEGFQSGGPLVAVVHGISRNAREHIVAFAPWARRSGIALVAPLFDREHTRDFQQLGWTGAGWRADHLLRRAVDAMAAATGADGARFALFGYSGGAQFSHRYAMAYPREIRALATCAAGYYTWPTAQMEFPYGLDCRRLGPGVGFSLDDFLAIPTLTTVGLRDTARDHNLRSSPELDALQGADRVERARRWVDALVTATRARQLEPRHAFAGIPGVAHDFRKAIARGLADLVWPFLAGDPAGLTPHSKPRTDSHARPAVSR
ncbi:MAG: hypothetical protein J0M16_05160 [Gammaproteobacteria bacterium]|nr:hypothetical protein [Gammaproteobacteria bacterium]